MTRGHPATKRSTSTKSNLGVAPRAIPYTLESTGDVARVAWGEECDLTADDVIAHQPRGKQTAAEQCADAIREILQGRTLESDELEQQCRERGFTTNAIRSGRCKAGVKVQRAGFGGEGGWVVSLPEPGNTGRQEPPGGRP